MDQFQAFRKEWIAENYNGDEAAYERLNANCFAFGKRPTTNWEDIERQMKCHPEYEELALGLVKFDLGYLPEQHAYMPYLAFLQTLLENIRTGKISDDHFETESLFYARKIRNEDMKRGGWVYDRVYKESSYQKYDRFLALYKQDARNRLCRFLGYEPLLEYSLDAEVFLRQIFQEDGFYSAMPFTTADYMAATVVKYREAFLLHGEAVADESDLVGLIYKDEKHLTSEIPAKQTSR